MDKIRSSRKHGYWKSRRTYLFSLLAVAVSLVAAGRRPTLFAVTLSHDDTLKIGKRIWQNECNGTITGLTSWNEGESFASLGIGHFIWYPKGQRGPFEESFPKLVTFISSRGAKLPRSLVGLGELPCPWNSRLEFLRAQQTPEMKQLRQFLADTVDLQTEFLIARLQIALPKMLTEAGPSDRPNVQRQFERMTSTRQGYYALVDYVNFKGEGVLHTERYQGQGWGLLQVLEGMHGSDGGAAAIDEFSHSAGCSSARAKLAAQRHESRKWLSVGFIVSLQSRRLIYADDFSKVALCSLSVCSCIFRQQRDTSGAAAAATFAQSIGSHPQAGTSQN